MAELIRIDDPADPRLTDYTGLRDVNLRRSLEAEQGLFIAEGFKIIERAVAAGYRPRSFLLAPRWLEQLRPIWDAGAAPVYLADEAIVEQLTGFHVHRGALASMEREQRHTLPDLLTGRRLVVCEDIVDHTNVGAIIRCAAGLGWDGVLLAPRAADPLYRRAIKTSMGAVFDIPWARMSDWSQDLEQLRDADFTLAAMALTPDALSLDQFADRVRASGEKVALLMGTEGQGLSAHWLNQADLAVQIPMSRGIDSLNVAAAAAVACYSLSDWGNSASGR